MCVWFLRPTNSCGHAETVHRFGDSPKGLEKPGIGRLDSLALDYCSDGERLNFGCKFVVIGQ